MDIAPLRTPCPARCSPPKTRGGMPRARRTPAPAAPKSSCGSPASTTSSEAVRFSAAARRRRRRARRRPQRVVHARRGRPARPVGAERRRDRGRSRMAGRWCASAGVRAGVTSRTCSPKHGLGISSGDTASVGVGGLTLGGGIGWMVRAWGLAADQLVGAQLVTAESEVIEVSASVASRAVLGASRRGRQLRGRDALRLPRARSAWRGVRRARRRR